MSDDRLDLHDVVIQRAARVLAAPERFEDDFERTLIEAIRAERPLRAALPRAKRWSPAWWRTPRLQLSPMTVAAMAAGIAIMAVLSALAVTKTMPTRAPVMTAVVHDTLTYVRFVFVGQAKRVTLVGDFNAWNRQATALSQTASGAWTVSIPVTNGRHEYAFIVDGTQWVTDPLAPASSDDFDTKSSIVSVGT